MFSDKKKKKNRRNIFSVTAAIGCPIIFAGVGIRIFGTSEKEAEKNNKSFYAFAELDKHMAEFEGENKKETEQETLESKENKKGQETFENKSDKTVEVKQQTPEDKSDKTVQDALEKTTKETEQQTLEDKTEVTKQDILENKSRNENQKTSEETTKETEQQTSKERIDETEQTASDIPENEINTVNQNSISLGTDNIFTEASERYFEDALFIGDSRTVGLAEYGNLKEADFFATVGMSVYNLPKQKTDVAGEKNIDIETLLSNHSYGKIYFMLGLNELGYNRQKTVDRYRAWLEYIRQMQPQAIIFIEANLHVTAKKSASDEECRNKDIDEFNNYTKELADNKSIFYVNVNELFDDGEGNLRADLTYDGVHILAKYYADWGEWLRKKAVIR